MEKHKSIAETVLAQAQAQNETPSPEPVAKSVSPEPAEATEPTEAAEPTPKKRNLSWDDAVKQVPPDIAKLMKDFRSDYSRKTQAISEERKGWSHEREALMAGLAELENRAEVKDHGDYDPFNEQAMQDRIESEVARRLKDVLAPMQRKVATMKAEEGYQGFLAANPDFKSDTALRKDVQVMLEKNANLDLETAYYAVKGRRSKDQAQQERSARSARRNAAREAALTGSAPSRKPPTPGKPSKRNLKGMSAADIYRLAQSMHEK